MAETEPSLPSGFTWDGLQVTHENSHGTALSGSVPRWLTQRNEKAPDPGFAHSWVGIMVSQSCVSDELTPWDCCPRAEEHNPECGKQRSPYRTSPPAPYGDEGTEDCLV